MTMFIVLYIGFFLTRNTHTLTFDINVQIWLSGRDTCVTDLDIWWIYYALLSLIPSESKFTILSRHTIYPPKPTYPPYTYRLPSLGPRYLIWTFSSRDESIMDRLPHPFVNAQYSALLYLFDSDR